MTLLRDRRRGDRAFGDRVAVECVFCLRSDRQMTREHIFARWLVRKIHGARFIASGAMTEGASQALASVPIARVVAPVCADCNAGWMSSLEVSFRQTLFAGPRVGELQRQSRITLSRWFAKTAVLLSHALGSEFLSPEDRTKIVRGMPEGIEVHFGRRRRPRQPLDFAFDLASDTNTGTKRVRSVAIQVDDVLAHVGARGSLASAHGTRLWPVRSHTLRWETLPVITRPPPM